MKLYKFKSLDGDGFLHSLDMIINERIYLPTLGMVNDPHEGGWKSSESRASLLMGDNDYLNKADKIRSVIEKIRFISFTSSFDNELLWAHYAGGFTGICFEYELSLDQHDIRKMDYKGLPVLTPKNQEDILDGVIKPQDVGLLKSKAHCWYYEDEYRFYSDSNSNEKYVSAKPERVILGARNLKYDDVIRQVVKKYDIPISYLHKIEDKYATF